MRPRFARLPPASWSPLEWLSPPARLLGARRPPERQSGWPRIGGASWWRRGIIAIVLILAWLAPGQARPAAAQSTPQLTWIQQLPGLSPTGRRGAAMAYDPAIQKVVLFGGSNGSGFLNDTWEWDGTTWTAVGSGTNPPPRTNAAMAYLPKTSQLVLFGGTAADGSDLGDTWVFSGSSWTQPTPSASPAVRDQAAMAYDGIGQLVLFGGASNGTPESDTWGWNGSTWSQLSLSGPVARYAATMVYDSATNQPVLFGGFGGSSIPYSFLGDTWGWNAETSIWSLLSSSGPSARINAAMDFAGAIDQPVLFGGGTTSAVGDTWAWTGASWSSQAPTTSPLARTLASMAFDTASGQLVLFGGNGSLSGTQNLNDTWILEASPTITSASSATLAVGSSRSFTVTASGYPNPSLSETGTLPNGVTFVDNGNGTATLSGTPASLSGGTYPLTISASNIVNPLPTTQSFTLTVDEAPSITSANAAAFTVGTSGSFTVKASGYPKPSLTEDGTLPGGLTFVDNGDGTATLSGTAQARSGGTYPLTIGASNGIGTNASQTFSLTTDEAPSFTSTASATFTVGASNPFTVNASGYPTPNLTETGPLPSGVTFTDNHDGTATLSGLPMSGTGGTYGLTIEASNTVNPAATQSFTLTIDEVPTITSANATTFTVGSISTFTVTTSGYPTTSLTETGALPNGVTFTDNGNGTATLAGTPARGTGGVYRLTLTAIKASGASVNQGFTLTVDEAPSITSASSATFSVGTPGSFTINTGGYPTPSLSETGTLPNGVSFVDNGNGTATLSGTPASGTGGTYTLTIGASNGIGTDATQTLTLTVTQLQQRSYVIYLPDVPGQASGP